MQTSDTKSQEYNLGVLKKHDPRISRVLHTAGHAVVYVYKDEESAESPWERHNVEGALFVVERAAEPRYQLLILNRLSTSNLVENITSDFSIEVTEEFLLYKNDEGEVLGLWFYNAADRESVARLIGGLVEIASLAEQADSASPQPATAPAASTGTTASSTVEMFFAAARIASSPPLPPVLIPTSMPPAILPLSADALGLLSKLQGAAQAHQQQQLLQLRPPSSVFTKVVDAATPQPRAPPSVFAKFVDSATTQPPPAAVAPALRTVAGIETPSTLDPAVRAAIRQALARVVQEDRFMVILEEEYAKLLPAPAATPPVPAVQASVLAVASAIDPKDGNALLKNLLSGMKL
ncbi:hypothetical protein T492DRAFT_937972 [Pavlovales sp. CCMP2436]|nr:hypothetical protein T492DRAFT_937972 [Pavlovales sp. CCMP2436]|mmetsp:Transcript_43531/g.102138  ORF Transcript_43531/g.102138 Transcript_43531/m.102138 type:complete len:350 (+) Transcript_43531:50-1099(+)